tara:strand:- start:247 stop:540 length:294 start_codon:yes stop_codon:yes gene_type:complete
MKMSWVKVQPIQSANTVNSCVLCSEDYKGFGHNPWPLNGGRGRCCDTCNDYVLLSRIARLNKEKLKAQEEILEKGELELQVDDAFITDFKNSLDMKV